MDPKLQTDLYDAVSALSHVMRLEGDFSGRDAIRREIKKRLQDKPLSAVQKEILRLSSAQGSAKTPAMAGRAFEKAMTGDMTWDTIAHHFTDAISKRISVIGMALDMGVDDQAEARTLYQNTVQLKNLAADLTNHIPVILGFTTSGALAKTCPLLGEITDHIAGRFVPAATLAIKSMEDTYGAMPVDDYPTGGNEFFYPFDAGLFNSEAVPARSTATSRQPAPEFAGPEYPSRK